MLQHKGPVQGDSDDTQDPGEVELASYRESSGETLPDEIPSSLFDELTDDSSDSAADTDTRNSAVDAGANATGNTDTNTDDQEPADRTEQMLQMLTANSMQQSRTLQALTDRENGTGKSGGKAPTPSRAAIMSEIVGELPTSDEEGSTFTTKDGETLVSTIMSAVEKSTAPQIKEVNDRLNSVTGTLSAEASDKRVQTYQNHLNKMLDDAGVTDPFERESMETVVTTRGMRQFGNEFNEARSGQIFRSVLEESRASESDSREQNATIKQRQQKETPEIQHGATGRGTATESIRGRLADSGDKAMDFAGGDFTKIVREVMNGALNR
jgi:hypothetical protein